jgi:hypothetical protein
MNLIGGAQLAPCRSLNENVEWRPKSQSNANAAGHEARSTRRNLGIFQEFGHIRGVESQWLPVFLPHHAQFNVVKMQRPINRSTPSLRT